MSPEPARGPSRPTVPALGSLRSSAMQRSVLLSFLVLAVACGGHHRAPAAGPEPAGRLPAAPRESPSGAPAADAFLLPPAPALDTLVPPEELAAELRLAADSAADEAVLE